MERRSVDVLLTVRCRQDNRLSSVGLRAKVEANITGGSNDYVVTSLKCEACSLVDTFRIRGNQYY